MIASGSAVAGAADGYSYEPLTGDTDIRLLSLSAGTDEDGLVCDLIICPLAKCPSFDALSYVWGAAEENHKISCDGEDLYITPNLHQALRQVRRLDTPRWIWADQICINQQDPRERGHQVSLMAHIYSQAHKVVACFGGTNEEGRELSAYMEMLILYMETEVQRQGAWTNVEVFAQYPNSFFEASGFRSLRNIFQHPYFTRIWVIQELGLANMPVVLVGDSEISWATLLECSLFLRRDDRTLHQMPLGGVRAHHYTLTDWSSQTKRHWFVPRASNRSFLAVLDQTRCLEVSDERDRIFAFLGHPTATMADGSVVVSPDYTTDLESCLYEFAKQWILKSGDLSILSTVDIQRPEKHRRLPSWVPTWQTQRHRYLNMGGRRRFDAGTSLDGLGTISDRLLTVRGVLLDSVSSLCPFNLHQDEASESLDFRSIKTAWTIIESHESLFTRGVPRPVAFIQTVSTMNFLHDHLTKNQVAFERRFLRHLRHQSVPDWQPGDEEAARAFASVVGAITRRRQFMISRDHGIMGLVPETTMEGDTCCIVAQCQVPLILRSAPDGTRPYTVVGEAYLHGYMRGEVAEDVSAGHAQVTELTLC